MGGYSVIRDGDYLGYVHASVGDKWNTYLYNRLRADDYLGKFTLESGVLAILLAARSSTEAQ